MITIEKIQNFINNWGLGLPVQDLVTKVYRHVEAEGHESYILNDRYISVDGVEYRFTKSRKEGRWIVKLYNE